METFTFIISHNGEFAAEETREAKSEKMAIAMIKKQLKDAGANPAEFSFDLKINPEKSAIADSLPTATPDEKPARLITLSPANSPAIPGEPKRIYPPSIKHPELGTFWGCDQAKLLDTLRLNPHALDGYAMRQTGSRTNFYLDSTLIWTTTKPISALAHSMALELIESLKQAA